MHNLCIITLTFFRHKGCSVRHTERPVILARLCNREGKLYLENERNRIEINSDFYELVTNLYNLSDGSLTVNQIVDKVGGECAVFEFFDFLESIGFAFHIWAISMYGHKMANYPDPTRQSLTVDEILSLQELPSDGDCVISQITEKLDPIDMIRRTIRDFSDEALYKRDLEIMMLSAYGKHHHQGRVLPSAGAMYPLLHFYLALNIEGLDTGLYRFANQQNGYYSVSLDLSQFWSKGFITDEWQSSALVHIIAFDIERSSAKYGSRAHRFALVEAGHSAQNEIRKATELGISSWEFGGYDDESLQDLLGLNSPYSGIATVILYGKKQVEVDNATN